MKTHEIFAIDKRDLCDAGCLRMAIHGLRFNEDGKELIAMKVCLPCLREQIGDTAALSR